VSKQVQPDDEERKKVLEKRDENKQHQPGPDSKQILMTHDEIPVSRRLNFRLSADSNVSSSKTSLKC
jgi:hypothetical protein